MEYDGFDLVEARAWVKSIVVIVQFDCPNCKLTCSSPLNQAVDLDGIECSSCHEVWYVERDINTAVAVAISNLPPEFSQSIRQRVWPIPDRNSSEATNGIPGDSGMALKSNDPPFDSYDVTGMHPQLEMPPLLSEVYKEPPQPRPPGNRRRLTKDQKRYIVYCLIEGDQARLIAERLSAPVETIRSVRRRVRADSTLLSQWGFTVRVERGVSQGTWIWCCRYCGVVRPEQWQINAHAWRHLKGDQ